MTVLAAHAVLALLLCAAGIALLERIAGPLGLIDRPTARKAHSGEVPLVGGLGIFLSFAVTMPSLGPGWSPEWPLVVGLAILLGLGALDDRFDLKPVTKLVVQVMAAVVLVVPGRHLIGLTPLLGTGTEGLGMVSVPLTIVFVVGLINAFNMIDGLDGLAGGVAASCLFWLAMTAGHMGRHADCLTLAVLLGATIGFLAFNMRHPWRAHARVFLGDSGSMILGAAIAYFILKLGAPTANHPEGSWVALLWLAAIPVIDTASLIVRRLAAGASPFTADRQHLHHLMLARGASASATTLLIVTVSFGLGAVGFLGIANLWATPMLFAALALPAAAHAAFVLSVLKIRTDTGQLLHGRAVSATLPGSDEK